MKLPNSREAIIDERKLTEYCLSEEHDEGSHKALLFRQLLGLGLEDAELLIAALRNAAQSGDASTGKVPAVKSQSQPDSLEARTSLGVL